MLRLIDADELKDWVKNWFEKIDIGIHIARATVSLFRNCIT